MQHFYNRVTKNISFSQKNTKYNFKLKLLVGLGLHNVSYSEVGYPIYLGSSFAGLKYLYGKIQGKINTIRTFRNSRSFDSDLEYCVFTVLTDIP